MQDVQQAMQVEWYDLQLEPDAMAEVWGELTTQGIYVF